MTVSNIRKADRVKRCSTQRGLSGLHAIANGVVGPPPSAEIGTEIGDELSLKGDFTLRSNGYIEKLAEVSAQQFLYLFDAKA
jgi:hypothetical protein